MENLIVLNNEKVSSENNKFYSRNYNFKILPEGLNKHFNVEYIVRKSNTKEPHKLNMGTVKAASNIIPFIYFLLLRFQYLYQRTLHSYYFIFYLLIYIFF